MPSTNLEELLPPCTAACPMTIMGRGPAGLAAARDLLHKGYRVTLFERESEPGHLMQVVPKFRLPRAMVSADLHELEALGADFLTGHAWGRDSSLRDLKEQGYQAIMLATACKRGAAFPCPGCTPPASIWPSPFCARCPRDNPRLWGKKC